MNNYSNKTKIGKMIAVFTDSYGLGSGSTTAAMIATSLANRGKKTLLISMDHDNMDAVTYLTDSVTENTLDDVMILANSNGLSESTDFDSYVYQVSEGLDVIHGSSKFDRMSGSPADCMLNIVEVASYKYHFIVIDIQGRNTQTAITLTNESDLVIYAIGQSMKQIENLISDRVFSSDVLNDDVLAMYIATNYIDRDFFNTKVIEKKLKISGLYTISHDEGVMKSSMLKNLFPYIEKACNGKSNCGFFGIKRSKDDSPLGDEINSITDAILEGLSEPEEETTFRRRRKKNKEE